MRPQPWPWTPARGARRIRQPCGSNEASALTTPKQSQGRSPGCAAPDVPCRPAATLLRCSPPSARVAFQGGRGPIARASIQKRRPQRRREQGRTRIGDGGPGRACSSSKRRLGLRVRRRLQLRRDRDDSRLIVACVLRRGRRLPAGQQAVFACAAERALALLLSRSRGSSARLNRALRQQRSRCAARCLLRRRAFLRDPLASAQSTPSGVQLLLPRDALEGPRRPVVVFRRRSVEAAPQGRRRPAAATTEKPRRGRVAGHVRGGVQRHRFAASIGGGVRNVG